MDEEKKTMGREMEYAVEDATIEIMNRMSQVGDHEGPRWTSDGAVFDFYLEGSDEERLRLCGLPAKVQKDADLASAIISAAWLADAVRNDAEIHAVLGDRGEAAAALYDKAVKEGTLEAFTKANEELGAIRDWLQENAETDPAVRRAEIAMDDHLCEAADTVNAILSISCVEKDGFLTAQIRLVFDDMPHPELLACKGRFMLASYDGPVPESPRVFMREFLDRALPEKIVVQNNPTSAM